MVTVISIQVLSRYPLEVGGPESLPKLLDYSQLPDWTLQYKVVAIADFKGQNFLFNRTFCD